MDDASQNQFRWEKRGLEDNDSFFVKRPNVVVSNVILQIKVVYGRGGRGRPSFKLNK